VHGRPLQRRVVQRSEQLLKASGTLLQPLRQLPVRQFGDGGSPRLAFRFAGPRQVASHAAVSRIHEGFRDTRHVPAASRTVQPGK
jgi:hypothetical protein